VLLGEEGLERGGEGCERKARWAWSVGVSLVVARPDRWSEGRCSREYRR
jgi:hypothetical protein